IILAGRRLNDGMGAYVVHSAVKMMLKRGMSTYNSKVLVLGLTFKENCPDLRNTRVVDIVSEFEEYGAQVDVYDPWVDADEAEEEYGLRPIPGLTEGAYDAVILAVAHREFQEMGSERIRALCTENGVLYDVKHVLPVDDVDARL
ncbi:MAG: UDP binding domain-containing protein, partial [Candidatus Thiodiazotropha sp. 6PDIVS]